jgi:hypothetical protein
LEQEKTMKTILTTIASVIAAFGVVIAALGLVAHGQSLTMTANVPFDFFIGETPMHAGNYTLRPAGLNPGEILMKDDSGVSSDFLLAIPLDNTSAGELKLVFHRYGDQYFLSEIWDGSYKLGLPKSEKERELMASNAAPVQVALIARR